MSTLVCFCLLAALLTSVYGFDVELNANEYAPEVITKLGAVRGIIKPVEGYGSKIVYHYQGIRYGRAKRFTKAQKVQSWHDNVYNATHVRFACPQHGFDYKPNFTNWTEEADVKVSSDDCLFLSIWQSPTNLSYPHGRPVMIWFHGYRSGSIFSSLSDARYLALIGNVIVVTVNYRVGPFGFLATPEAEKSLAHPSNLGLYDIQLALEFVRAHIDSFGGDRNTVTIFGDAVMVGTLLTSPPLKKLFHRAILSQGAPSNTRGCEDKSQAVLKTQYLARLLECDSSNRVIDCLVQNKTVPEIIGLIENNYINFEPIYPEHLLPNSTSIALQTFERKVDVMFGVNSDEGVLEAYNSLDKIEDLKTLKNAISKLFSQDVENSNELAEFYTKHLTNASTLPEQIQTLSDAYADYHYVCPTIKFGQTIINRHNYLQISSNRYYAYRVIHPVNSSIESIQSDKEDMNHTFRDFYLLFGLPIHYANKTLELDFEPFKKQTINFNENERKLSQELIHAWTRFAHSGVIGFMQSTPWERANKFDVEVITAADIFDMQLMINNFTMQNTFTRCDTLWKYIKSDI